MICFMILFFFVDKKRVMTLSWFLMLQRRIWFDCLGKIKNDGIEIQS